MAKCKSCGAEIVWATDETTAKPLPLNAKRVRVYTRTGEKHVRPHYAGGEVLLGYVSHFTTCPNASQHSRARGQQPPTERP